MYHLSQVSPTASNPDLTETTQYSSRCQVFLKDTRDVDSLSTVSTDIFVTEQRGSCQTDSDFTLIKQNTFPEEDSESINLTTMTQDSDVHVYERLNDLDAQSPKSTSRSPGTESLFPKQLEGMEPLSGAKTYDQDDSPNRISESFEDDHTSRFKSPLITEHKTQFYQAYDVPIGQEHSHAAVQEEPKLTKFNSDETQDTDLSFILEGDKESPLNPTVPPIYSDLAQAFCEVPESSLNANIPSGIFQPDLNNENESSAPKSFLDLETEKELEKSEKPLTYLPEGSTSQLQPDNTEFKNESLTSPSVVNDNISTSYSENQQLDFKEEASSLSDVTPETVTEARHFIFEEIAPKLSSELNDSYLKSNGEDSEGHPNVNLLCFPSTITPKQGTTLSTSEEDSRITSHYAETGSTTPISSYTPPKYLKGVLSVHESHANEGSDQEDYFDCKQAESDFSETEAEKSDFKVNCSGTLPLSQVPAGHQKIKQKIAFSSGSEDFEDAYIHVGEPLCNVDEEEEEELIHHTGTLEEEFTMCEASQPPALGSESDDADKYLTRVR